MAGACFSGQNNFNSFCFASKVCACSRKGSWSITGMSSRELERHCRYAQCRERAMGLPWAGRTHTSGTFSQLPSSSFAASILSMQCDSQLLPDPFFEPPTKVIFHIWKTQQFLWMSGTYTLKHTNNQISRISKPKQAGEQSCASPHSFSYTLQRIWRRASQETTCFWVLICRGSKCCLQAARKHLKIPPKEKDSTCAQDFHPWAQQIAPAHQEKVEVGKAAAHQMPWCTPEAQILPPKHKALFLCLLDYKKASVCFSKSDATKNTVFALTQIQGVLLSYKIRSKH